ncbi:MAG: hypothetical protein GF398_16630 [Chitinivibrionales bacterium]|nr:hypothetical protein [Chitinivibrionales bacterium]
MAEPSFPAGSGSLALAREFSYGALGHGMYVAAILTGTEIVASQKVVIR